MRLPAALLLALLLAPLAPVAAGQAATAMPLPQPGTQARWEYNTTLHADQTIVANATARMARAETVQVGSQVTQAYRVETVHGGPRAGETTVTWYRVSDLAKVRVSFVRPEGETHYTLGEACREWRFPMRVGDAWSTSCAFNPGTAGGFTIASNWSVVRAERITVPAGSFDALVLEQRGEGFTERWWFAPAACWWVRHDSLDAHGAFQSSENLTRVEGCQPPAATTPVGTSPAATSPAATTPQGTSPAATSPPATGPSATSPAGLSPATPTGAGATTPAGATPAGGDTPGFGVLALLLAAGIALGLLARRR